MTVGENLALPRPEPWALDVHQAAVCRSQVLKVGNNYGNNLRKIP